MPNGRTPYSTKVKNAPSSVPVLLVASTTATINTTYSHATEISSMGESSVGIDRDTDRSYLI